MVRTPFAPSTDRSKREAPPFEAAKLASFSTFIRTVLEKDSGRINVTRVVVMATRRKTARITVLRMRMMRQ